MAMTFYADNPSFTDRIRDAVSEIPLLPVVAVNITMPLWSNWMLNLSDTLAVVAQAVAVLIALIKCYEAITGGTHGQQRDAVKSLADAASVAAKKGATTSGTAAAVGALAVLGILAALPFFKKTDTPPLAIISTSVPSVKGRKRTKDDAGEDGDADAPHSPGGPAWYQELTALIGTHEGTARKPNPVVQKMFADAGFPKIKDTTATPWCAAGVNAVLERSGNPGTKALDARSFLRWGEELDKPVIGCIVVLWRVSPKSWQGHVGLYAGETATHILVLGCNQSDSVTVAKFPKSKLLGYRWPRKPATLKTAVAAKVSAASSAVSAATQATRELEGLKEPLQQAGMHKWAGYLAIACALLAMAAALYANRQRIADFFKRGQ